MRCGTATPRLEIYVTRQCLACNDARRTAAEVKQRFPMLSVEVVDIDIEAGRKPHAVFSVPTYVLNDRIVSLGNPAPDDLFRRISDILDAASKA